MWFQNLKMTTISRGQGRSRSYPQRGCTLPLAMSLPRFVWILTKIDWEKSAKMWFFKKIKMAAILRNLEQLGPNFALHSGTTQDMCVWNIIRISLKLRALGPAQRFEDTFWILLPLRWLQSYQTHIGPTIQRGLEAPTVWDDLESRSRWPRFELVQDVNQKHLFTKFCLTVTAWPVVELCS